METKMIRSDDLNVGDWIQVVRGPTVTHMVGFGEPCEKEDKYLNGWPLKVIAISRPFLLVSVCGKEDKMLHIDTRDNTMTKCDEIYAKEYEKLMDKIKPKAHSYQVQDSVSLFKPYHF